MRGKMPQKAVHVRVWWLVGGVVALLVLMAVLGSALAQGAPRQAGLPAYKQAVLDQQERLAAASYSVPEAPKPAQPTPPASVPEPVHTWGLLPAGRTPVPFSTRQYRVENEWLGEVNGRFVAVYAGAEAANPEQGVLVVFRPDGPGLQVYRLPGRGGGLTILGVQGAIVTLSHAGRPATFDLATGQFQM